jgi:hypothetical protein
VTGPDEPEEADDEEPDEVDPFSVPEEPEGFDPAVDCGDPDWWEDNAPTGD